MDRAVRRRSWAVVALLPANDAGNDSSDNANADDGPEDDDDDLVEVDRGEEAEVDDASDLMRRVKVIAVDAIEDMEFRSLAMNEQKRRRRTWDVYPIRKANARTGGL